MNRKDILNKCFGYAGQRAKLGDAVESLDSSVSSIRGTTPSSGSGTTLPAEDAPSLASLSSTLSTLSSTVLGLSTTLSNIAALTNCTITFNSDGGSSVSALTVPYGTAATAPTPPTKSDYTFAGWTQNGVAYDWTALVTANITLTATWTATPAEEPVPDGST